MTKSTELREGKKRLAQEKSLQIQSNEWQSDCEESK